MATTTIRVDTETHARLLALSEANDTTLMATVAAAAEALQRLRFAATVTTELASLRADRTAWTDYLADADATSVSDGVG